MQRALEAAFAAHQWVKAEQILSSLDKQIALKYYKRIAAYYASVAQYKVSSSFSSSFSSSSSTHHAFLRQ